MAAPRLAEATTDLILDYVKTNIATALGDVRTDRADALVVLPEPQSYFRFQPAKAFKAPAIFVIVDYFDFKISDNQANHINAVARVNVSIVLENREKNLLVYQAYRFQSALHELLAQTHLTSTDNKVKLTVVIKRATFSPEYSTTTVKAGVESVFRKEVLLECDVVHRENY